MKAPRQFMALVAIAVIALFPAFRASGAARPNFVVASPVPTWLPMFTSSNAMVEWLVTNQPCYVSIGLHFMDNTGTNRTYSNLAWLTSFSSYAKYQNYVATNGARLASEVVADWNPTSQVWISVAVNFDITTPQPQPSIKVLATNVLASGVTAGWISNNLAPSAINIWIPVSGLNGFSYSMTNPAYSYSWSNGVSHIAVPNTAKPNSGVIPPIYPPEQTRAGWIGLSPWCCLQQYRARFSVTVGAVTQNYTQAGYPLLPASMVSTLLPNKQVRVDIYSPPGSDMTLMSSVQFNSSTVVLEKPLSIKVSPGPSIVIPPVWLSVATNAWSTNMGFSSFTFPASGSQRYFNTRSD